QRVLIYAPDEEAIAATLTLAPDGVVADDPFVLVQAIGKRPLGSRAA
ncbi:MAG: hypothetical protein GY906_39825, partial [bacterium]|nr:hypothetical protein [bacterium]